MKLSIIIPSFNTGKFIRQAIDSVLDQAYPYVECIVIDGGSTDGTIDILKSYGERITWISGKDNGEPDAVNIGMGMASGEVLAYLDADDIYLPNSFAKVMAVFERYPDVMWLYGKGNIINEESEQCRGFITKFKEFFQKRYSYSKLLCVDFIVQPTVFWRRELSDEIGQLPIDEKLAFEYDFWLRVGAKYHPAYIDSYLASWRAHGNSETANAIYQDMKDALRLSRKYSKGRPLINLMQLAVYLMAISGYFVLGVLRRSG